MSLLPDFFAEDESHGHTYLQVRLGYVVSGLTSMCLEMENGTITRLCTSEPCFPECVNPDTQSSENTPIRKVIYLSGLNGKKAGLSIPNFWEKGQLVLFASHMLTCRLKMTAYFTVLA